MNDKEKKYIVNYQTGIIIFSSLIIIAIIVFGFFYRIQNKKDQEFELSRPLIPLQNQ